MLIGLALIVTGLLAATCFFDERKGLYICLLVGFLQNPVRKLVPGEPVYFVVAAAGVLAIVFLGIFLRGGWPSLQPIHRWDPRLRVPLAFFVIWVVFQSAMTFMFVGSPVLAAIGLIAYLTPFPMGILGYYVTRGKGDIFRGFLFYAGLCALMMAGTFLSFAGYEWSILETVGSKNWVVRGIELHSGFFRSPEMTGWHAQTALVFAFFVYLLGRRTTLSLWAVGIAMVFFGASILVTGRRKFVATLLVFFVLYGSLRLRASGRLVTAKGAAGIGVVGLFGVGSYYLLIQENLVSLFTQYVGRAETLVQDADERLLGKTIGAFGTVVEEYGLFGGGAGIGSQGAQYYGGGLLPGAEGGINKIMAELGVPGLVFFAWLGGALLFYLNRISRWARTRAARWKATCADGVIAFLAANALTYTAAHQVFGDVFIMMVIGWVVGIALALPTMESG